MFHSVHLFLLLLAIVGALSVSYTSRGAPASIASEVAATTAGRAACPDAERVHELEIHVMELEFLLMQTRMQLETFLKNESNFQCPYGSTHAKDSSDTSVLWRVLSGGPASLLPALSSAFWATWKTALSGCSQVYRALPEEWRDMLEDAKDTVVSRVNTAAYFANKRRLELVSRARRALRKQGLIR